MYLYFIFILSTDVLTKLYFIKFEFESKTEADVSFFYVIKNWKY